MKRFFGKTKKVVFFDMNQTLIDPKLSFKVHFLELLDEYTGRWDDSQQTWDIQKVYREYEKEWKTKKKNLKTRTARQQLQQTCFKKVMKSYAFTFDQAMYETFFKELSMRVRKQPHLYDDALRTLQELSATFQLAVISNGHSASHQLKLGSLIPEEHFFTAKKYGFRKPHPKIFQAALKAMNISADEAVMVGNAWKADIQGAVRNGLDAIWIQHQANRKKRIKKIAGKKVIVIRQLSELLQIL